MEQNLERVSRSNSFQEEGRVKNNISGKMFLQSLLLVSLTGQMAAFNVHPNEAHDLKGNDRGSKSKLVWKEKKNTQT